MPVHSPNKTVSGSRSLSEDCIPTGMEVSKYRFASSSSQEYIVHNTRQKVSSYDATDDPNHTAVDGDNILIINDTLMVIDVSENGTMGCAFFSTHDNCLSVAQDVLQADEQTLQHFLAHIQPTSIFISARFPDDLALMLDDHVDRSFNEGIGQSVCVTTLPNADFSISTAKDRISSVSLVGKEEPLAVFHSPEEHPVLHSASNRALPGSESASIRYLRLRASSGLENSISMSCVGVLITEVYRRRTAHGQSNISLAESSYEIYDVKEFTLAEYLYINSTAMSSLRILHRETHPNVHTWNTNPNGIHKREGLSVYGVFNLLASTSQGRTNLRKILLRPSLHIPTITARHQAIATLLRPQNSEILIQMTRSLRRIPDMKRIIPKLRRGIYSTSTCHSSRNGVWSAIESFTNHVAEIRGLAGLLSGLESATLLKKFCDTVDVRTIASVGSLVNATIDFEQSKSRGKYSIRSGIDTSLDNLKRHYDGMESFLTTIVKNITEQSASWARQYIKSCIFLPQLGFLLVIELDETTGQGKYNGEGQSDDSWQKIFSADGSVCYKTRQMRDLDDKYGDVYCQIGDREVELLYQLAIEVLQQSSKLELASESYGELDSLLTLALAAKKYDWVKPTIGMNERTSIVGGRHPLYELSTSNFIPNDFGDARDGGGGGEGLDKASHRMLVVTGPNHSGKSVYLKQVALIVYLAHIGSFVPAEKANISPTDKILVCIPAHETATANESAFAADLKDILHAIKQATVKSLVIVDEFGKGTCPVNGAGLAAGLMEYFLALGFSHCPRVLFATHFHEIFEFESFQHYGYLDFVHMKVEINHESGKKDGKGDNLLTYLFSLRYGRNSNSFGEQCAAMNGVPGVVVNRAMAISSIISRNEDLVTTCARLTNAEQIQLQIAEEIARQFISYDLRAWNLPGEVSDAVGMLERLMSTGF